MKKAFFINGGAGRVLCSIPALERYSEKNEDFIIVAEGWSELFSGNKKLQEKVFDIGHRGLFEDYLKDKEIITPEPYRLNQYFNQKCNLIQGFDIIINELDYIPPTSKTTLELSKKEQIDGYTIVTEVRTVKQKERVIVFQPFGSGVKVQGNFIFDSSGRSFELSDVFKIIETLTKNYGVILMAPFQLPTTKDLGIAHPQNMSLRQWAGIINASDFFIGCDSVGQHIAYALDKPTLVVTGSTFPENISYPESDKFTIIDNGKDKRKYSPIRITIDDISERSNEDLMILNEKKLKEITDIITKNVKATPENSKHTTNSCSVIDCLPKDPKSILSYESSVNPLIKSNITSSPINKNSTTKTKK